ncbi:hypothetical protein BREVNS_1031 [Brevinematales bacterium NS]|nr:hypothetical protein [Brevinematales bacterium]QJR21781.1 hypothetical protein BREVNS_1031 [Brevinematales bacterium NS]
MMKASLSGQGWLIARNRSLAYASNHITGTILDPLQGRKDFIAFGAGSEKSQRSQTLLLGNEVRYVLEDSDRNTYVLKEAFLVSENREIKDNPEKLNEFFLLCDVWYHLLSEEKPFPEISSLFHFLKIHKHTRHLVFVHLIHLFQEENLFPEDLENISQEEKKEFLETIGLPHWHMGPGTQRFLLDALQQPLDFFVDKIPSPSVIKEILTFLKATYESYTGRELFSLEDEK